MSVIISNLPSYTGSVADLRWFVMNNSGETTTFKFSGYTSPFIVENYTQASIFSTFGVPAVYDSDCVGSTVIGSETAAYDDYTTLFGWKAIGNNDIEGRCSAFGADAQATSRETAAFGMSTRAAGFQSTALGHLASAGGEKGLCVGNRTTTSGFRGVTIGQEISNSSPYGTMINGVSNTLNSSGNHNNMFGGSNNTIGGSYSYITMLSCSGRTADADNTTYTENLHIYRTPSTRVQSVSSGTTFTCNLNNGAKSQFYLTGVSTVDITNVRDGQSFLIKTQTDGGHSITWTSTGYTFKWKGGSSNPGNNKIDLFRFEVFGSVIYGELISDFS
jgi:hypothetical protein